MVVQNVPRSEKHFIEGDFNGYIRVEVDGYDTAHEGFGYEERNYGGVSVLDFAVTYDLLVANSFFKKKDDHLVTFRSGLSKSQIDFFLIRTSSSVYKDCKVLPSECLGSQHRLLVLDVELKGSIRKRRYAGEPRIKWWNLTRENALELTRRISEEGVWKKAEDADTMWEAMANRIQRLAKEILGTSRRGGHKMNGAWW